MDRKYCIVIAGPTGVGKTAMAIELARQLGTDVLSADSRQCYREMNIGVARPSLTEQAGVRHHFIASHSIASPVNAADFEQSGLRTATEIFEDHDTLVVAGGTGLYLKAFLEGMDPMPVIPDQVKTQVRKLQMEEGITGLLLAFPPDDAFLEGHELGNPHRVMRALEVRLATGRSIRDFQHGGRTEREFIPILIGLDLPRKELYARIDRRVDAMMDAGLLEEVRTLLPLRASTALQTVGYRELFEYLDGALSLERAVERIKQHTRQYAKRQLTWFRRMEDMHWFLPDDAGSVLQYVRDQMRVRI
jgi:tRNA dimethylallyltransferase